MSAFIVENLTINRVVAFLLRSDARELREPLREAGFDLSSAAGLGDEAERLGYAMGNVNWLSYNRLYAMPEYRGRPALFGLTAYSYHFSWEHEASAVDAYKALQCWLYQSCEHGCDQAPVWRALRKVCDRLAHQIVYDLPAYQRSEAWS